MAPTEAVTPTACTCDCEEGNRIQLPREDGWQDCECTFCGPVLEDGSRRCKVKVSPILKLRTAFESDVGLSGALLAFCGDCCDECRRQAGEAGKDEQGQAVAHVTP